MTNIPPPSADCPVARAYGKWGGVMLPPDDLCLVVIGFTEPRCHEAYYACNACLHTMDKLDRPPDDWRVGYLKGARRFILQVS